MVTLTGSLLDAGQGVLDPKRTRVRIESNASTLGAFDAAGHLHLGGEDAAVAADGSFEFTDLVSSADIDGLAYQVLVEYPTVLGKGRGTWASGWFPLAADTTLAVVASIATPQAVPITTLEASIDTAADNVRANTLTAATSAQDAATAAATSKTNAAGSATAAATSATNAATSASHAADSAAAAAASAAPATSLIRSTVSSDISTDGTDIATQLDARTAQQMEENGSSLAAATDSRVASLVPTDSGSATSAALTTTFAPGLQVAGKGAKGDGTTDDTSAFAAAITAANAFGFVVDVGPGTFVVDTLGVSSTTTIRLAPGATIKHKAAASNHLFVVTSTRFSLLGPGSIDGNQANQTGRRYAVSAPCPKGTRVDVDRVTFVNTQAAAVYTNNFGGFLNVTNCHFSGMDEHDGVSGHWTAAVYVESGQTGQKGYLRFNHNTLIGTNTPAVVGGAPGGLFFAPTLDYANGVGNFSSLEAIGNYFWGIGQNCSVNDIGPIHTYPALEGARIIGNYFEQSGFSAIAAKSVQNFICQGNYIVNGQYNAKNVATEGAISYAPGYHSGSVNRPRAVITGNIIDTPGGESTSVKQDGITILGVSAGAGGPSLADDYLIEGNTIIGAGVGIRTDYSIDGAIKNNIIEGSTGGTAGTEHGIKATNVSGDLTIAGNELIVPNGHGLHLFQGLSGARLFLRDNKIKHSYASGYAAIVRGAGYVKFTGNDLDATANALSLTTDGTNPVGTLVWDETNRIISGGATFSWANVTAAEGQLQGTNSPLGAVNAGKVGTTYRQTNGSGSTVLWVATGTGTAGWAKMLGGAAGEAALNKMLGWTFDPTYATAAQAVGTAGVIATSRALLPLGGSISNIFFHVSIAGAGLTAGQCFVGVYDQSGNLLGTSADLSGVLTSTGAKTVALTTPTAALTPGALVDIALVWNGTTSPQLRGISGTGQANIGIVSVADNRNATAGTGQTSLPATLPAKAADLARAHFFGVS